MFNRRAKKARELNTEINITAFMNLMVVLVPFLLITAVFSQVSVLDLTLPNAVSSDQQVPNENPPKALEVIIRKSYFDVQERNSGSLQQIANLSEGHNFAELNRFLQQVKAHPEFNTETSITLLMEMDTPYEVLVQTMDAVRMVDSSQLVANADNPSATDVDSVAVELFPSISLGDAPPEENAAATTTSAGGQ